MSIRTTTIDIVRRWARIPGINNTLTELCVLWASGNPGLPCSPALQPLIGDLKRGFPSRNLSGLRPSDMSTGSIKTVEALISFVASSPPSNQPFALVSTRTLDALASLDTGREKPRRKDAPAKSSKSKERAKEAKKLSRKKTKTTAKKGRKRSAK